MVLSIADCCFVSRGDDGGDDDNYDEFLNFAVASCNCCVWMLEPDFYLSFFLTCSSAVRSTMTMKSQTHNFSHIFSTVYEGQQPTCRLCNQPMHSGKSCTTATVTSSTENRHTSAFQFVRKTPCVILNDVINVLV